MFAAPWARLVINLTVETVSILLEHLTGDIDGNTVLIDSEIFPFVGDITNGLKALGSDERSAE